VRIITVKIPEAYLRELDELVRSGMYPSRSEAIRVALRELLKKELYDRSESSGPRRVAYIQSRHSPKRRDRVYEY